VVAARFLVGIFKDVECIELDRRLEEKRNRASIFQGLRGMKNQASYNLVTQYEIIVSRTSYTHTSTNQ